MKVKAWVEFEQEVEVDVSIAEMMGSIEQLARSDQLPMIFDCINRVHRVLVSIPQAQIAGMSDIQRNVIRRGLSVQAARYAPVEVEGQATAATQMDCEG